ncbi:MAG: hypothetical protein PWR10_1548 [Halanaerobiales bacterium]|nr:hypothetical protein [Halanaerobiales bacterium]
MSKKVIVLNSEIQAGDIPEMIQIVPIGSWTNHPSGPFKVTEEDIQKIIINAQMRKNDIVIDYEHQTLKDTEAPAAAWIKKLINKGPDGLWGVVEWTPRAKKYLENKEYKYLSPVLLAKEKDEEGWNRPSILHSAALTNKPFIDGMVPIVNKYFNFKEADEIMLKKLIEILALKEDATEKEVLEAVKNLKGAKAEIAKALDLKEDVSEDEILAALKDNSGKKSEGVSTKIINALDLNEDSDESEVVASIHALKQKSEAGISVEEFNQLKKKMAEKERDELVQLAMKQGKITPAQKEWAKQYALNDPKGFKAFIDKAPVVVPLDDGDVILDNKNQVNDIQAIVNKNLGVDDELFKKYNEED